MKKIVILLFSLLCIFVCSCNKTPRNLLLGTWQVNKVVMSVAVDGIDAEKTLEYDDYYYLFSGGGVGKYRLGDDIWDFTYTYNRETGTIVMTREGSETIMTIEALTDEELIFHSMSALGSIISAKSQVFCTRVQ